MNKEPEKFEDALNRFYDYVYSTPIFGFTGTPDKREKRWMEIFARWLDNDQQTTKRIVEWIKELK